MTDAQRSFLETGSQVLVTLLVAYMVLLLTPLGDLTRSFFPGRATPSQRALRQWAIQQITIPLWIIRLGRWAAFLVGGWAILTATSALYREGVGTNSLPQTVDAMLSVSDAITVLLAMLCVVEPLLRIGLPSFMKWGLRGSRRLVAWFRLRRLKKKGLAPASNTTTDPARSAQGSRRSKDRRRNRRRL